MAKLNRDKLGEWLSAYLDGELTADQTGQVERFLREDAEARRLLDELRVTVNAMASIPRHRAPDSIAENLQTHVERAALLGVPDDAPVSETRRSPLPAMLATAAVITLLIGGLWVLTGDSGPEPHGDIVAMNVEEGWKELEADEDSREFGVASKSSRGLARKASPSSEPASTTAGTGASLLATASLEQKLNSGFGLAAVRTHRFRNESVRLQVTVGDESQRDAVMDQLVTYLQESEVADVSQGVSSESLDDRAPRGFFYLGVPTENFSAAGERQVLVRVPFRRIEGLMEKLSRLEDMTDRVALVAGAFSFQGLQRSRQALRSMEPGAAAAAEPGDLFDAQPALGKSEPEEVGPFFAESSSRKSRNPWAGLLEVVVPGAALLADAAGDRSVSPAETADVASTVKARRSAAEGRGGADASSKRLLRGKGVTAGRPAQREDEREDKVVEPPKGLPSLVDRRLAAARTARRRSDRGAEAPAARRKLRAAKRAGRREASRLPTALLTEKPTEEVYVTLVIQVKLVSPPTAKKPPRPRSPRLPVRSGPDENERAKQ